MYLGDIPSPQEMEAAFPIPSVQEMERAVVTKKKVRVAKPKPLCKYGPRDQEGYCPKKPSASSVRTVSSGSTSPSAASKPFLDPEKLAQKVIVDSGKAAAQQAVRQVIPKIVPSKKERAAIIRQVGSAGKGAVGKILSGTAAVAGTAVTTAGVSAAAVAAAGLAAGYFGTTYILDRLAEKKLKNTPEYRKYEAALAYAAARRDMAARLGRELNDAELKLLAVKFKEQLLTIGG